VGPRCPLFRRRPPCGDAKQCDGRGDMNTRLPRPRASRSGSVSSSHPSGVRPTARSTDELLVSPAESAAACCTVIGGGLYDCRSTKP
jgi:hypothetical protein